jgi:hypothetical protein
MSCKYTVNGKEDALVNDFMQYLEDNGKEGTADGLYEILIEADVLSPDGVMTNTGAAYPLNIDVDMAKEVIDTLNEVYIEYFTNTSFPGIGIAELKVINEPEFQGATIQIVDQIVKTSVLIDRFTNSAKTGIPTSTSNEGQNKLREAITKLRADRGWRLTEDETRYVRTVNGIEEYGERVTTVIKGNKNAPKLSGVAKKHANRGTIIDDMLRASISMKSLEDRYPTFEEFMDIYNNHQYKNETSVFDPRFIRNLHQVITTQILPKFKEFTLMADIPALSGIIRGELVVGTPDIVGYTPDGEFIIIDLKTATYDRREKYNGADNYDVQLTDALQLVSYQELIRQITGISPKLAILPLQVDYNSETDTYYSAILNPAKSGSILLENTKLDQARNKLRLTPKYAPKVKTAREIKKDKIFSHKEAASAAHVRITTALKTQLEYLNKRIDSDPKAKSKIKQILSQLRRVDEGNDAIEDYMSFLEYIVDLANEAEKTLESIKYDFSDNIDSISRQDKFKLLNKIIELKLNLDNFYNNKADNKVLELIRTRVRDLEGDKNEILELLDEVEVTFSRVNSDYLNTALPILAKTLLSYAPIKVNQDLDNMIKQIKDSIAEGKPRVIGLDRDDNRVPALFSISGLKNIRSKANQIKLSEINIQQLEERKIGYEQILHSLRETHKDASAASLFFDPVIYSNDTVLQLIAQMIKDQYVGSAEQTRSLIYDMQAPFEEYRAYMKSLGVSEDTTAKFHEPLMEEITLNVENENGEIVPTKVLSFVSEIDRDKWYRTKDEFIKAARKKYGYPENGDKAAKNEFFKSEKGRLYWEEIDLKFWKIHGEKTEDADQILSDMDTEIANLRKDLTKAYNTQDNAAVAEIWDQLNYLNRERNKIYRNGVFIGRLVKPKMSMYANPKYTSMPAEVKKYYDVLLEIHKNAQKITGKTGMQKDSWMDYSLIVPSIESGAVDDAMKYGFVDATKKLISRGTQAQVTDTEFLRLVDANNELYKYIPLYFTNRVDANLVSRNLTNSMIMFSDMAHRFRANSNIYGAVTLVHLAIQNRKVKEIQPNLYGKTKNFIANKIAKTLGYQIDDYIEGGLHAKQLESFIDNVYYGETHERARRKVLNTIATRKGVSILTSFTSLAQLGLNGLQATNQLLVDWTVGAQESWAGEYYSRLDWLWASGIISAEGGTVLRKTRTTVESIIGKRFTPNQKLSKFLDWSETSRIFQPDRVGSGSMVKKIAERGLGNLHVLQEIPDVYMTSKKALALQRSYKGQLLDKNGSVILNNNNEPADLYDLLNVDKTGNLVLDPRVANFNKTEYVSRMQAMLTKTTQLKGAFNRPSLERKTFGPLVTLFRTWMVPNYRKRFGYGGGIRIDVESGELQEGYYSTLYNVLRSALGGNYGLLKLNQLTELEKRNLKRFLHGFITIQISGIAATLFGLMLKNLDDDDDEQYWIAFATYQAMRLNTEYKAYSSYEEAIRVVQSPTATTRPLENIFNLVDILIQYGVDNELDNKTLYYQRKTGQYEKGDAKVYKYLKNISPGIGGLTKTENPKDAIKYYDMFMSTDDSNIGELIYENASN